MIGRTHRFHGRGGIKRLYTNGQSVRTGALSLRYAQVPKRQTYRLAVVVSRKVSKSAVVRNRIRRRIYELVRILYDNYEPYDLLVSVFDAKLAGIAAAELNQEVTRLFKKAKLTTVKPTSYDTLETKD